MAKGNKKPSPLPPVQYGSLDIQLHPQVPAIISASDGAIRNTDSSGYIRLLAIKGETKEFKIEAEGYRTKTLVFTFNKMQDVMPVFLEPKIVQGGIFGDWLTCRHFDGSLVYPSVYPVADDALRIKIMEAMFFNKYTDTFVDVAYSSENNDDVFQHQGWNFLESDPQPFIDACKTFLDNGIRPIIMVGYQKDIAPPFPVFIDQLKRFMDKAGPYVTGVVAGAEAEEYWKFDEIIEVLVTASKYTSGFLGYHGGRSSWGPDGGQSVEWKPGGRQVSWWKELKRRLPARELALFYQYPHFIKHNNGGFSTSDALVIEDTETLLMPQRLGDLSITFIAAEMSYKVEDHIAKRAGDLARKHGAHGTMNGGNVL